MSCKTRGIRKAAETAADELYASLHRDKSIRPEPRVRRAMTVMLLLYWWGKTAEQVKAITEYEDCADLLARMRHIKLVNRDAIDVTAWERKSGLFAMVVDALAVTEENQIDSWVPCPACGGRMNRAGKQGGRQRWKCTTCGKSTSFPGTTPEERLRVPIIKRREMIRLHRKRYTPAAIAQKTGVSVPTVKKILALKDQGADLTVYKGDLTATPETPGAGERWEEMGRHERRLGEARRQRVFQCTNPRE